MSVKAPSDLTPTEGRIFALLSDGLGHTFEELHACLDDELAESRDAVHNHVTAIRTKVGRQGLDVVTRGPNGHKRWRLVRYISHVE